METVKGEYIPNDGKLPIYQLMIRLLKNTGKEYETFNMKSDRRVNDVVCNLYL